MTNYDEIKNMSIDEMAEFLRRYDKCRDCCFEIETCKCNDCQKGVLDYLKRGIKPALSEAERVILENIDKDYKWIARDKDKGLFVYAKKPSKNNTWWVNESYSKGGVSVYLFNHLFQFITWQDNEPYNIEELLKGE